MGTCAANKYKRHPRNVYTEPCRPHTSHRGRPSNAIAEQATPVLHPIVHWFVGQTFRAIKQSHCREQCARFVVWRRRRRSFVGIVEWRGIVQWTHQCTSRKNDNRYDRWQSELFLWQQQFQHPIGYRSNIGSRNPSTKWCTIDSIVNDNVSAKSSTGGRCIDIGECTTFQHRRHRCCHCRRHKRTMQSNELPSHKHSFPKFAQQSTKPWEETAENYRYVSRQSIFNSPRSHASIPPAFFRRTQMQVKTRIDTARINDDDRYEWTITNMCGKEAISHNQKSPNPLTNWERPFFVFPSIFRNKSSLRAVSGSQLKVQLNHFQCDYHTEFTVRTHRRTQHYALLHSTLLALLVYGINVLISCVKQP